MENHLIWKMSSNGRNDKSLEYNMKGNCPETEEKNNFFLNFDLNSNLIEIKLKENYYRRVLSALIVC